MDKKIDTETIKFTTRVPTYIGDKVQVKLEDGNICDCTVIESVINPPWVFNVTAIRSPAEIYKMRKGSD